MLAPGHDPDLPRARSRASTAARRRGAERRLAPLLAGRARPSTRRCLRSAPTRSAFPSSTASSPTRRVGRRRRAGAAAGGARGARSGGRARRAVRGRGCGARGRGPGRGAEALSACGRRLPAGAPPCVPRRRAGARQDDRGAGDAAGRRCVPGDRRLPGEPEAQLGPRDRARGCPAAASARCSARGAPAGPRGARRRAARGADVDDRQLRHPRRTPAGAAGGIAAGARDRRGALLQEREREAHTGRAAAGRGDPARRDRAGAERHAGRQPAGRADRPAADHRAAGGVRLGGRFGARFRARRPPAPALAPARALLRAPAEARRAAPAAGRRRARSCRSSSTTRPSTGSPSATCWRGCAASRSTCASSTRSWRRRCAPNGSCG